ncbi:unnamed protein product [Ixodes pacificus]
MGGPHQQRLRGAFSSEFLEAHRVPAARPSGRRYNLVANQPWRAACPNRILQNSRLRQIPLHHLCTDYLQHKQLPVLLEAVGQCIRF